MTSEREFVATATLDGEEVEIARHSDYVQFLGALRQWFDEQGDLWFDMPDKRADLLTTGDVEALGVSIEEEGTP